MKTNDTRIEQRIYQKAAELISKRGIKGWNMDQLAESAGLAKNTLYKMIGSKENLLLKVIIDFIVGVQTKLSDIMAAEEDYPTALKKTAALFPELLVGLYTDTMHEVFMEYPELESRVRSHQDDMTSRVIGFFNKGIDCGILDPSLNPFQVYEILQAVVLYYMKQELNGPERSEKISAGIHTILTGLLRRDAPSSKEEGQQRG